MTQTFSERLAASKAKFQAEWNAAHAPLAPTNDDPCNPHKHYADTAPESHCMPRPDGTCFIPHQCRCSILWACNGGCYR